MRRKNQNSKLPRIWHYVALGRVSALPWEMIKESESSYSVKKEKTQQYHKRNQCVGRFEEVSDPLTGLTRVFFSF